jgi:hypothetical protein
MWWIPDGAPALALYRSGSVGLKTKSFAAAFARVDGLVTKSADILTESAVLVLGEPASDRFVESIGGPLHPGAAGAYGTHRRVDDATALCTEFQRTHDEAAAEAWERFGAPTHVGRRMFRGEQGFVEWEWHVEEALQVAQLLPAWTAFATKHGHLAYDERATRLHVRAEWQVRLVLTGGEVGAPYPRSRVSADLRARHASGYFYLVLPHEAATPDFAADHDLVNRALGRKLPVSRYKLSAPKKGGGRTEKKLPGL